MTAVDTSDAELMRTLIDPAYATELILAGQTAAAMVNAVRGRASSSIVRALAELDREASRIPKDITDRLREAREDVARARRVYELAARAVTSRLGFLKEKDQS